MKTELKVVKKRLETYNQRRHKHLYSLLMEAFGHEGNETTPPQEGWDDYGDGILRFPDVMPYTVTGGQSDLMRARAMIAQARLSSKDPEPEFMGDIPLAVAQVRQAFYNHDYHGLNDEIEGFGQAMREAFLDMDSLGYGGVRFGLVDAKGGNMRAAGRYIKRLYTMFDPHKRTPVHARWAATWDWMEIDEVAKLYGWNVAKRALVQDKNAGPDVRREALASCRVLEYFDMGYAKGDPTYMVFVGSIDSDPVVVERMKTDHIPIAWGVNFVAPGMSEPIGSIQQMIAAQAERRSVMQYFQEQLEKVSLDIYDQELFDETEMAHLLAGETRVKSKPLSLEKHPRPPITRLPAADIGRGVLDYYNIVMDEFNTQSNMAELDRGNMGAPGRSATEWAIMDKRMAMNQALQSAMVALFQRRTVVRHEQAAMLGDTDPRALSVRDATVRVNVPGLPESAIQEFIERWPAEVVVSTQSLTADEDEVRRMAKTEKLLTFAQIGLIQDGTIDRDWWSGELVDAAGFDPDQALTRKGDLPGVAMAIADQFAGGMPQGQPQGQDPLAGMLANMG